VTTALRAAALSLLLLSLPASAPAEIDIPIQDRPLVRVLVSDGQKSIPVSVKGAYRVRLLPSMQIVKNGSKLVNVHVSASRTGIRFGTTEYPGRGVRIEPVEERDLFLRKARYRGMLDILKDPSGGVYAINRIDVESYLYGVLHHEVSPWWPMEALKAQAIAARSYALYQASVSTKAEYDVKSTTSSQVYGGSSNERFRSKSAVDKTAGQVLAYEGKIFPAYFHSVCAGQTAASNELWKIAMPPLSGRVLCGFCRISPHSQWNVRVPVSEIEEILARNGRPLGRILETRIVTRTPSNRAGSLRIVGTQGETTVAAKDFRVWIGGDRLRSTTFSIVTHEDAVEFRGRGWGHGVGLCQWGTLGQSLLGRKHDEILQFYYRESEIKNVYL